MPECWWFARYGYCSSGDECLYAHPRERKKECPDYNRGFCKLGEHVSDELHSGLLTSHSMNRTGLPSQACTACCLSVVSQWILSYGSRVSSWPVRDFQYAFTSYTD